MLLLALDTATMDLVTGVVSVGESATAAPDTIAERILAGARAHNELLIPTVQELLQEAGVGFADLGGLVVGCGPGPFTGLRVGMASASALGQALQIPVHGACTHDAIARAAAQPGEGPGATLVVTDARRREVYWALYRGGERAAGPGVVAPAELAGQLPQAPGRLLASVELAAALPPQLRQLPRQDAVATPAGLVAAADLGAAPGPLVPLYLRRPDAKVPAAAAPSPAIAKARP